MKRFTFGTLLVVLVSFELYLATAYLPARWQFATDKFLTHALLRQDSAPPATHPALDEEIHRVASRNPFFTIIVYAFITAVLLFNAFLIMKTWSSVTRKPR